MGRPLTDRGLAHMAMLPTALRASPDYQGVIHPIAREFDRLDTMIEQVRAQWSPATADILLPAWEVMVRLPAGGAGASIEQRRQKVISRLHKVIAGSEGREWEQEITELVGAGWSYEEHIPGDPSSPPAYTLRIALPFPPASDSYLEALREIREVTPAHLEIEFSSGTGFLVDESRLDLEGLGD